MMLPDRRNKRLIYLAAMAMLVYVVNRTFIIPNSNSASFFSEYLGDFLALPVYLPLSIYAAMRLHVISADFKLSVVQVFGAVIIFSILFEGIIPVFSADSVRDSRDILAYLGGGIVVYCMSQDFLFKSSSTD